MELTAELSSTHHALPVRVEVELPDEVARLRAWQRGSRILLELVAAITVAALCWRFWHPVLYVFALAFIGARQYSVAALMQERRPGDRSSLIPELFALGVGAIRLVPQGERDTLALELARAGFMLTLLGATWYWGAWLEVGLFWLIPLLTWAALTAWIRPKLGFGKKLEPRV